MFSFSVNALGVAYYIKKKLEKATNKSFPCCNTFTLMISNYIFTSSYRIEAPVMTKYPENVRESSIFNEVNSNSDFIVL